MNKTKNIPFVKKKLLKNDKKYLKNNKNSGFLIFSGHLQIISTKKPAKRRYNGIFLAGVSNQPDPV